MGNPEQPRHRFNLLERWKNKRKEKRSISLLELAYKWDEEIESKLYLAWNAQMVARFTHQGDQIPENGYYYSLSHIKGTDTKVLIIDRDRENGHGERHAIVTTPEKTTCLKTINPPGSHGDKDPHTWEMITDHSEGERFLRDRLRHFKDSKLVGYDNNFTWRGYNHDAAEVLAALPEKE